jgi:hypothetical protein
MITNQEYLIQRMAEAQEKIAGYTDNTNGRDYWRGIRDAYHAMLNEAFDGWASGKTTGYYVFYENMTYDEACAQVGRDNKAYVYKDEPEEGELFAI